MLIKIYPENPNPREIKKITQIIEDGGVVIYPTDTIYGIGCDISQPKAVARLAKIQGLDMDKAYFSFIFNDLSQISEYTKPMSNPAFKLLKRNVPGAFTFIFEANNNIPKLFKTRRKTVGIRVPDNNIIRSIVAELGRPLLSSSVHDANSSIVAANPIISNLFFIDLLVFIVILILFGFIIKTLAHYCVYNVSLQR